MPAHRRRVRLQLAELERKGTDSPGLDDTAGGEGMRKCQNTTIDSYCCLDYDQDICDCNSGQGTVYFAGQPRALTTIRVTSALWSSSLPSSETRPTSPSSSLARSLSTSTPATLPASTVTTDASPPSSPLPTPSSTHNRAAIGVGVGVPIGVVALALLTFHVLRYRKGKNRLGLVGQIDAHHGAENHALNKNSYYLSERRTPSAIEFYDDGTHWSELPASRDEIGTLIELCAI